MIQQPTDNAAMQMQEVVRLRLERIAIQKKLDAIDREIDEALGIVTDPRPKNKGMTGKELRAMCGGK